MTDEAPLLSNDPRDLKKYYVQMTLLRRIVTPLAQAVFRIMTVQKNSGAELLPAEGPVILAANHLAEFDVLFMQFALPRPIYFMGKEELFRNPVVDWAFRQLGGFPVYRGARDAWAMAHAQRVLEHGLVLGMFPEGTRSRGQGLAPAKTGIARLAIEMKCPIVPMAIDGPQRLFKRFPRRTRITVNVGQPIIPGMGESKLELTDRVMFALAEMLPAKVRGAYMYRPPGF